jgi:CarD family transcriptional regulator
MFSVGEKIIYGGEGVCTIDKIDCMNISGISKDKKYYYLTPLYRGGTIYAPVDTPVFMRSLITKDEALDLIYQIPNIEADTFTSLNIRLMSEHYQSIIKSYKCQDLIKVMKAIYKKQQIALKKDKKLGSVDERFLQKAENMLFGELAVALSIERNEVDSFIRNKLDNQ